MTETLVERLRKRSGQNLLAQNTADLLTQAADRIEGLEKDLGASISQSGGDGGRAATSGSEPSAVWVVMATSGEWSDRSEWPICAYRDEASAQAKVDDSTARVRAAQARLPEAPEGGFGEDYDEKAWGLYNSEYAALLEKIADLGGSDFDLSFFVHEVPFGSPLQPSPAGSDGGGA